MDVRRSKSTSPPGTARMIKNAHVSQGGEIIKRKAFVEYLDIATQYPTLAGKTAGLAGLDRDLFTFTSAIEDYRSEGDIIVFGVPGMTLPLATIYSYTAFDGRIYLIAEKNTGELRHYWAPPTPADINDPQLMLDISDLAVAPLGAAFEGKWATTLKTKIHAVSGKNVYFHAPNDPLIWDEFMPNPVVEDPLLEPVLTSAGFINVANAAIAGARTTGVGVYHDQLAIFTRFSVQTWFTDPLPESYQLTQVIGGIGTVAPRSILPFGNGDLFFLSSSGVRSLERKDVSTSASISDLGSPIDPLLQEKLILSGFTIQSSAVSLIEPISGRFWLILDSLIYVLSFFPGPKVTAWSIYDPGFTVDDAAVANEKVFLRSGDKIYVYGGLDGLTYDNTEVEVELPFLDSQTPASFKIFDAIDVGCEGVWDLEVALDPRQPDLYEEVATVDSTSFAEESLELSGRSTHCAPRFKTTAASRAVLSNLALHFEPGEVT